MLVGIGVQIGHRIRDRHDIIAVIVGVARRRFHAHARRNAGQENLGYAAPTENLFEGGPIECAYL